MAQAADTRFNSQDRPHFWLIHFDMDPAFFELPPDEQYRLQNADVIHSVALAFNFEWKAGYISTDLKQGWLLFDLGQGATPDDAVKILQTYPIHKYFLNVVCTPVFSGTQGAVDPKALWGGFREFIKDRISPQP